MDQATLMDKIKTGTTLCKAIMRNGYDAYAINAPLQGLIFEKTGVFDVDIACACDTETLFKIFPNAVPYTEEGAMAMLQENGVTLRFYSTDVEDASHPEMSQLRITPRLARLLAVIADNRVDRIIFTPGPRSVRRKRHTVLFDVGIQILRFPALQVMLDEI